MHRIALAAPRRRTAVASLLAGVLAVGSLLLGAPPARAATLTQVTDFGSNPGNLAMYLYRPDGLPDGAPLVVALHGCTQTARDYHDHSGWAQLADRDGFAVALPQTSSANNANSCFNWFEPGDTSRGSGEVESIRQMVAAAISRYGADPGRVYVTGLSAGGAMTAALLAAYPDVFAAGSIVAGLPYRCATTVGQAYGCMSSPPDRSPTAWGDLVRGAYPGYSGPRPRVAIWHGTSDTTVVPANARESIDQFTDVLGVSRTPTDTESLPGGTELTVYGDGDVLAYSVQGMGHGLPVDPGTGADQCGSTGAYFLDTICSAGLDAEFFGLTASDDPEDPPSEDPVCVTASNYAHTRAGRAYASGGHAYAVGSGDDLGLWNTT